MGPNPGEVSGLGAKKSQRVDEDLGVVESLEEAVGDLGVVDNLEVPSSVAGFLV